MERSEWVFWQSDNMLIHPDGRQVRFTPLEADFVSGVLRAHGHIARKEYLYAYIFGSERDDSPDPKELNVILCKVRKALSHAQADFTIATVHRAGFHPTRIVEVRQFKIGEDCCPMCGRLNEEKVA